MAADEELKAVYNIFTDVWKMYKKYADVRSDDEYWEDVVNETNALIPAAAAGEDIYFSPGYCD